MKKHISGSRGSAKGGGESHEEAKIFRGPYLQGDLANQYCSWTVESKWIDRCIALGRSFRLPNECSRHPTTMKIMILNWNGKEGHRRACHE